MRTVRTTVLGLFVILLAAGCASMSAKGPVNTARETVNPTALDRYVAKPDPNYKWELVNTFKGDGFTSYVLDMTLQKWRNENEVDHPIWKHWVTVVVPKKVTSKTALMIISGGSNKGEAPGGASATLQKVATATNAVVAEVKMIPNEPLVFLDDKKRRSEDSIIAYTWDKYLKTGDEEWPLRLPMTKAVVRAMDSVQAFCGSSAGGKKPIETFMVAGASKRGWTTWTTAVVDKRVIAAVPMVIDMLNIVPSFRHHKAVYGRWAPAVGDYDGMGIMDWMETKEYDALMKIVEPYNYRARLTMPKLLINSCGDQFFLPDSAQFYIKDLQGPTYLRYVPNTGHGLNGSVVGSIESFYGAVITGAKIPSYKWSFPDAETIRVETPDKPTAVKLWQASNPAARDFRLDTIGKDAWKGAPLAPASDGAYVAHVATPEKGWAAFIVELTFPGPTGAPFTFTTPIRIVPEKTEFQYQPIPNPPKGFMSK